MAKYLDQAGVSVLWGKVKEHVAAEMAALVDNAPEALDTLGEIASWIQNDETGAAALINKVAELEDNQLTAGDGIVITEDNKITINEETIATVDFVDATNSDTMSYIIQEINNEYAGRVAGDNLKVDKKMVGTNGTAMIFNEADGGGAHFAHNDGSEVFVGVNDGGLDGMMAQIYADENVNGTWVGSRINVYNDKIYYTNRAAVEAGVVKNNADYEIATKGDLANIVPEIDALTEAEILEICQ